tara:strand:- start:497 stop:2476 length:1980 start_codon:yes stop_codon:yes gene_type:complete
MKKSMKINFDIKIILKYVILISFLCANENVLETIKRKSKEIKNNNSQSSLLQATDAQIVKKAISHENAGLIDEAHLIFKQLFEDNKTNSYIYNNYKNFLIRQEDWSQLINISRLYSSNNTNNTNARLALAENLLYVSQKDTMFYLYETEGYEIINELIIDGINNKSGIGFSKIKRYISRLIQYDKFDFALDKIQYVRNNYDVENFYSKELAKYYLDNRNYQNSIKEYILCLSNQEELNKYLNKHYGSIEKQLSQFPNDENTRYIITNTLLNNPSKIKNNILAQFKFKWEDFDGACDLMIENHLVEKNLYDFGVSFVNQSSFKNAEKIFKHLMTSTNSEIIELSILQLAKIIEKKSINNKIYLPISDRIIQNSFLEISPFGNDNINYKSDELSEAVIMYDSLIEKYNNSRARYNIANLKSNNDDNYEKSLNDFYALEQNSSNRNIRFKSAIKIIEIKIKNNLINDELIELIKRYKTRYNKSDEIEYLDLKYFQLLFYLKQFDDLKEKLEQKLKNIDKKSEYYNEFLNGLTLLMLFNENNDELIILSDALYKMINRQYDKSTTKLESLTNSTSEIVRNLSFYYLAYIYINIEDYQTAKAYLSLIETNDIYSELSLLLNAELDDFVLNDINSAVDNYLKFMDNFQHSVFYEEIRLRLERIIG